MLSIGIPVYNYNILPLVERLYQEASSLPIAFEILVCDDASTEVFQNEAIEQFPHTRLLKNGINRHVAYTRNRLLSEAQYPWVLLLDADVYPLSSTFILNYLKQREQGLFFQGGFTYDSTDPKRSQSLRLKYGIATEQYKHIHSCCNLFFNQRELQLRFDETITTYGYEDTLFFLQLEAQSINCILLNNKVVHQSTESNASYLARVKEACHALVELTQNNTLDPTKVQLSAGYQTIQNSHLAFCVSWVDFLIGRFIKCNLLGNNPSLFALKLFKLIEYHKSLQTFQKVHPLR